MYVYIIFKERVRGKMENIKIKSFSLFSVMGQFRHPNVVKLYGVISRVDPVMIVMEYLENGSLDRYLQVI